MVAEQSLWICSLCCFLKAASNMRSVRWQHTVSIWYQTSSVCLSFFFSLFIVFLLLCYMKYLNGKVGYLAPTVFCCCCRRGGGGGGGIKTTCFDLSSFLFCAVLRFTLFVYYLFTWWLVHAHVLLGVLGVCTGTPNNTLPPCNYCTQINWTSLCDEKNMKMTHWG